MQEPCLVGRCATYPFPRPAQKSSRSGPSARLTVYHSAVSLATKIRIYGRVMRLPRNDRNSLGSPYVQRQELRSRVHLLAHSCQSSSVSGQRPLQPVMQRGFPYKPWSNSQPGSKSEYLERIDYILLKGLDVYRSPFLLRQVFVMSCKESTQRNDCDGLSEIRAANIPGLLH
jgi:hypothetical protein